MFLQYLAPQEQKVGALNTPIITVSQAEPRLSAVVVLF